MGDFVSAVAAPFVAPIKAVVAVAQGGSVIDAAKSTVSGLATATPLGGIETVAGTKITGMGSLAQGDWSTNTLGKFARDGAIIGGGVAGGAVGAGMGGTAYKAISSRDPLGAAQALSGQDLSAMRDYDAPIKAAISGGPSRTPAGPIAMPSASVMPVIGSKTSDSTMPLVLGAAALVAVIYFSRRKK